MKDWLEQLTGKITMYLLVFVVLCFMLVWALSLSLLGHIGYTPVQILASSSLLVMVSYLSNRLLGWAYGIRPQGVSALITGLILFFIFSPTDTLAGLLGLTLVALFAQASKYVLAVRGRHVFNPVAIAAVVAGLVGVAYTSWWVATPVLLPITLLGGFLVLYKTRHLAMGAVFVVVAYGLIVMSGLLAGQTLGYIIVAAAVSWPLFFFAGFMLSEPLTLPPRRWQQIGLAGLVAILFALPMKLGAISMTPEIALVIVNGLAFTLGQRRGLFLTLTGVHKLTPTSRAFTFKTDQPLHFKAGQYIELALPHARADLRGLRRILSIVSAPGDNTIELGMKIPTRSSSFKQALMGLPIGAQLSAPLISGDFVLPRNPRIKLLFIASGIGITPFISQLKFLASQNQTRDIVLIYLVRNSDELAYVEIIRRSGVRTIVVSEHVSERLPGWFYAPQSRVDSSLLESYMPDLIERMAYVSGPPLMVEAASQILKALGVKRLKTDHFSGY